MKSVRDFATYVSISAGMALAASSFTMLAVLFGTAPPMMALLAIPVAGLLSIVVAGSIGSLASMYPSAPGIAVYLGKAFGSRVSLLVGLLYVSILACLAGGESFVFASIVQKVAPGALSAPVAAAGILALVVLVNLCGLELPMRFQIWTTIALIVVVLAMSFLPLLSAAPRNLVVAPQAPAEGGLTTAITAVGMGIFLFLGFEWVTPLGRAPKHYEKLVPLSMPVAILLLTAMYGAFALSLVRQFSRAEIAATAVPQFLLASVIGRPLGPPLALAMCALAMTNTFNAGLMGAARLVYGLSRDGSLPPWCSRIAVRTGAPYAAILLAGGISIAASLAICGLGWTVGAVSYSAALECFVYGALVLAWLKLQRSTERRGTYRSPFPRSVQMAVGIVMPILGVGALFPEPKRWHFTVGFFLVSVTGIALLSLWLHGRRRASAAPSLGVARLES
jgi:amino acid transporter